MSLPDSVHVSVPASTGQEYSLSVQCHLEEVSRRSVDLFVELQLAKARERKLIEDVEVGSAQVLLLRSVVDQVFLPKECIPSPPPLTPSPHPLTRTTNLCNLLQYHQSTEQEVRALLSAAHARIVISSRAGSNATVCGVPCAMLWVTHTAVVPGSSPERDPPAGGEPRGEPAPEAGAPRPGPGSAIDLGTL